MDDLVEIKEEDKPKASARRFNNHAGDWKKAEKFAKEAMGYSEIAEKHFNDGMAAFEKMKASQLEAFKATPVTDALYNDSPISPYKQTLYLKMHLKKLGWDGVRDVLTPSISIQLFSEMVKDSCKWLLKFKE